MKLSVVGVPVSQGSKTAYPFKRKDGSTGVAMTEGGKKVALKEWRALIAAEYRRLYDDTLEGLLFGPVTLYATFYLPRPKSAPKSRLFPDGRPDCSKLIRAAEDALTKLAYEDDSRIVTLIVRKRFAIDRSPGVEIELRAATEDDL